MPKKLIGAHVSIAGGLAKSVENALKIGANCMQIFGSSPRQWQVRFPDDDEIEKYKDAQSRHKIKPVFLHAPYLVNLASPKKTLQQKSYEVLRDHLKIAKEIDAEGLIFHMGSYGGGKQKDALKQTVSYMRKILNDVKGQTWLIMEVSSGGGSKLGDDLKVLGEIMRKVGSERVKLCLDTAHAFTAGLLDYTPGSINDFVKQWKKHIGLNQLVVVHANDSKADFASKSDRHENIGQGKIGKNKLQRLARRKEFNKLPWILEVPGFGDEGPDKKNIQILKKLLG